MTIAYPREIPSTRIASVYFEAEPSEAFAPENGGRFVGTQLGPPLWQAKLGTKPPSEVEFSKWRAWLDSLDGAGQRFYGYDFRRPMPWHYRHGFADLTRAVSGGAFNGTSTEWELNVARDEITVGGASGQELPAAFKLVEGDYLGLQWDTDKRSLHRIITPFNADGSGVGVWTLRPFVNPDVPIDAVVNFIKPSCLMRITKRDRDAEHIDRRIEFEAIQDLVF